MLSKVVLACGQDRLALPLRPRDTVLWPRRVPRAAPAWVHLRQALAAPVESAPLRALGGERVLIIVSDETRKDPRGLLLEAVARELGHHARAAVVVARGTHTPLGLRKLGLRVRPAQGARERHWFDMPVRAAMEVEVGGSWVPIFEHDAHGTGRWLELGWSVRGTPLRISALLEWADVVVATGVIRPHYFAGFGGGVKALFPGLGENRSIRENHRLKAESGARAGAIVGNPCRDDMEEVLQRVPCELFLLNGVEGPDGRLHGAVAGEMRAAFCAGAEQCASLFTQDAAQGHSIIVSGGAPLSSSLYQACKMLAAVAPLCTKGSRILLVAGCAEGVGPLEVVNEGIYRLGIAPRLPEGHEIGLLSGLSRRQVERTFCRYVSSLEQGLAWLGSGARVVVPEAGRVLWRRSAVL